MVPACPGQFTDKGAHIRSLGSHLRHGNKKAHPDLQDGLSLVLAGATRLELATSGVTGRRYNRLNYAPVRTELPLHEFLLVVQQENHLNVKIPTIPSCLPRALGDMRRADGRTFWEYRAPALSWHPV